MAKSLQELLAETRGISGGGTAPASLGSLLQQARRTAAAPQPAPTQPRPNPLEGYIRARKAADKLAEALLPKEPAPTPKPAREAYLPDLSDFPPQPEQPAGLVYPDRAEPGFIERTVKEMRRLSEAPTDAEKAFMLAQSGRYTPGVPIEEQKALEPMGHIAGEFAKGLVAPFPVPVGSAKPAKSTAEKVGGIAASMVGRALNPVWTSVGSIPGIKTAARLGIQAVAGEVQRGLSGEKVTPKEALTNVGVSTLVGAASDYLAPAVQRSVANTLAKHFPETLPKGIEKAIPYVAPFTLGATVGAARGIAGQAARVVEGEPVDLGQAVKEIGVEAAVMGAVNAVMAGLGLAPKGQPAGFYKAARQLIERGATATAQGGPQWTMLEGVPNLAFQYDPKTASVKYVFGVFYQNGQPKMAENLMEHFRFAGVDPSVLIGVNVPSVGPATGGVIPGAAGQLPPAEAGIAPVPGAPQGPTSIAPTPGPAPAAPVPATAPPTTPVAPAPGSIAPATAAPPVVPDTGSMQVGQQYVLPPELGGLRVGLYNPKEVGVDPDRFQFKTTGKGGVTGLLKGVSKWRPELAGRILIWEDKEGRPWVVNGHHRLELAQRLNVPAVEAQVIREADGVTDRMARMRGALANIAEGRGDAIDVAKFLRDSGISPEDLVEEGISLREKTAAQGVALSGLGDQLWRAVLDGDLKTDLAVVIGRDLPGDVVNQQAVAELVARLARQGRHITPTILEGVIAQVKSAETSITTQETLFGEDVIVSTSAVEKAEILEYVLKKLRAQKALFNKVSKSSFTDLLEKAGNVMATEKNLEELTAADMGLELVQQLAYSKGSAISEILNRRAQEMVTAQNRDEIKKAAFEEILAAVKEGKALEEPIGGEAGAEPVQAGPSLFGAGGGEEAPVQPQTQVPPAVRPQPEGQGGVVPQAPAVTPPQPPAIQEEFTEEIPPDLAEEGAAPQVAQSDPGVPQELLQLVGKAVQTDRGSAGTVLRVTGPHFETYVDDLNNRKHDPNDPWYSMELARFDSGQKSETFWLNEVRVKDGQITEMREPIVVLEGGLPEWKVGDEAIVLGVEKEPQRGTVKEIHAETGQKKRVHYTVTLEDGSTRAVNPEQLRPLAGTDAGQVAPAAPAEVDVPEELSRLVGKTIQDRLGSGGVVTSVSRSPDDDSLYRIEFTVKRDSGKRTKRDARSFDTVSLVDGVPTYGGEPIVVYEQGFPDYKVGDEVYVLGMSLDEAPPRGTVSDMFTDYGKTVHYTVTFEDGSKRSATREQLRPVSMHPAAELAPKAAPQPPAQAKAPWQMTREEFGREHQRDKERRRERAAEAIETALQAYGREKAEKFAIIKPGESGEEMVLRAIRDGISKGKRKETALQHYSRKDVFGTSPEGEQLRKALLEYVRGHNNVWEADKYPAPLEATHKDLIERALKRGDPVPPEVLAEYPDLAGKEPVIEVRSRFGDWKQVSREEARKHVEQMYDSIRTTSDPAKRAEIIDGRFLRGITTKELLGTPADQVSAEVPSFSEEIPADLAGEFSEDLPPDLMEEPEAEKPEVLGFAGSAVAPGTATAVQSKSGTWYPLYVTEDGRRLFGKTAYPTKEEAVARANAVKTAMEKPKEGKTHVPTVARGKTEGVGGAAPAVRGPVERREPAPGAPAPAGRTEQVPSPAPASAQATGAQAGTPAKREVINARPDIPMPDITLETRAKFDSISEVHEALRPHQVEGTLHALQALEEKGSFACVDGPGAGKTRVGLAVGYAAAREGKAVLVLTENDGILRGAWLSEADAMGISARIEEWKGGNDPVPGLIQVATYSKMRSVVKQRLPLEGWDIVILDECHNLKRTEQSQQAAAGEALINNAEQVLFMSATPFDRIHEYWYMGRRLGTFSDDLTFEEWLDDLGVEVVEKKINVTRTNKITGEEERFKIKKKVYRRKVPVEVYAKNLKKMGDDLTRDGLMIKREVSMDGLDVFVKTVALPEEALAELDDIAEHYNQVYQGSSRGSALTVIMQRRFLEKYKVDMAVEMAKEELEQGRQVGIFVEYKSESAVEEKVKIRGEWMVVGTVAHAESVIKSLREKLSEFVPPEEIAELHGGLPGERPPDTEAERLAFQRGEKKIAIATTAKGSTGISLHDDVGERPRTQIVVTLPWSGVKQIQVAGRMHRLTSETRTKLIYLMADHEMDEHLAEILAGKMQILGATVQGDLQKLDLQRGQLLADLDEATVRGSDDELDEGERMDNERIDAEIRETQLYEDLTEDGLQRIDVAGPAATGNGIWMAKLTGLDPRYGFEREFMRSKRSDHRHAYFEVEPGAIYEINDASGRRILQATGHGWTELSGPMAKAMLEQRKPGRLESEVRQFIAEPGPHLTQLKKGGKKPRGAKPPPSPASIIKLINDKLTPVFMKHLSTRAPAEYQIKGHIIRLREVKLTHALHELGHHLDEHFYPYARLIDNNLQSAYLYTVNATTGDPERGQIPLDPQQARPEIAAELFSGLMIEPEEVIKVDPAFNQFDLVLEAMGLSEEIGELRQKCKEYLGMDILDRMDAQIIWTTENPDKLRWRDLVEAVFDQFDGIRRAEEEAVARAHGEIKPSEDAYVLAQLAGSRAPAIVDYWLTVGQFDKVGKPTGGKSLLAILEPIKGAEETQQWVRYATAKVARHRIVQLDQTMPESLDFYDAVIARLETPERLKVLEEQTEWAWNFLEFLQTISMPWSPDRIQKSKHDHPLYLPLHRAMDERLPRGGPGGKKYASLPNPVKKTRGSTRPFLNPLVNLVQNAYVLADFALKNEVGKAFVTLLAKYPGSGPAGGRIPRPIRREHLKLRQIRPWIEEIVEISGGDPEKVPPKLYDYVVDYVAPVKELLIESENILSVWHKGDALYYQLPKDVFRAFRAMGGRSLSTWMKIFGLPARLLHATAIMNPSFAILRNPVTDISTAFTKSAEGQKPVVDWIRGLVSVIKKDPTVDVFKYMGGTFMKPSGWSREEYERNFLPRVLEFQRQQRARGRIKVNPLALFTFLDRTAETFELPSRVREMQLSLSRARWDEDYDKLLEAVYNGLEVTMNWRKSGYLAKEWSSVAPFFSTKFVIAKKTFDAWTGKPTAPSQPARPGAWKGMFIKSLLMFTLPTLALFAINRKNKDYEELPDWRKVGFWNVPIGKRGGRTVFLPLPRVSWEGLLFGGMVENVLVNLYTEDKVAVDEFLKQVAQDALPSLLPTFFQWMLLAANLDPFTKRPIVPEREKDLPVEEQVAPYTTAVARILGSKLGISPRKIDAAIKTYSSGLGSTVAELLNIFLDGFAKSGRLPQSHPANWVGMRGFLVDPYVSSDSVNELYDMLAKSRRAIVRAEQGYDLSASEMELAAMSPMLEEGARMLSACRATERDLRNMPGASKKERAKAIDVLRAVEIDIARLYLGKSPLPVPDVDK